ncbi:MAG: enoyl-CoA hydratase/isomerase family protein [Deltaproteobacteria bacterium]|nr:MAG: enoyl-CoA hydratase/isomerase family protein [Deltaproteobacteria bacterium]
MSLWRTEMENGVVTATFSSPPMNYIGAEATRQMADLIRSWEAPEVRAIVVQGGVPGKFITHYHGEELAAIDPAAIENSRTLGMSPIPEYNGMLRRLEKLPKPVIAAMNGDAMGGGFEFCLACDIRIGERGDYRYGLPETRLGLIPGGGGTQRLSRLIGAAKATEFILRGRIVTPDTAEGLGIVGELADDAGRRAREMASELASMPAIGLARSKKAIREGYEIHLDGGLEIENSAFADVMLSVETQLAVQRYLALPPGERRRWLENSAVGERKDP